MLNSKENPNKYRNPLYLNIMLSVTLVFTLFMSYSAVIGLINFIKAQ